MRKRPQQSELDAIARRLVVMRQALKLSQAEICKRTGIKPNTWNQYESATNRPNIDAAIAICREFGVTLDWIYFGDASGVALRIADSLRQVASAS